MKLLKTQFATLYSLLLLFLFSCGKSETPVSELKILEMDVFSIPAYEENLKQEIYCLTKLEGFTFSKENGDYKTNLNFVIDLVTTKKDTIKSIHTLDTLIVQQEKFDKILMIEIYLQLDPTFDSGNYELIINATDKNSGKSAIRSKEFEL